jgi:hypothetical protein
MLPRPSERIRRSVIVPIQMGGSFLISLASPLVSLATRMRGKPKQQQDVDLINPAKPTSPDKSQDKKSSNPTGRV